MTATNASAATFVQCTGDLVVLEGVHLDGSNAVATTCTQSGPSEVTQSGHTVTVVPVTYSCDDGDNGSINGGGTVNEKHIDFQLRTGSNYYGTVATDKYTGTKTSVTTFALDEWQVTFSGTIVGSCKISPRLRVDGVVSSPSRSPLERSETSAPVSPGRLIPNILRSRGER